MKKLLVGFLTAVCAVSTAIGLTACDGENNKPETEEWGKEYTVTAAYSKAVELGYDKTLEEFISTISGKDGKDGLGIKDVKFDADGSMSVIFTDDTSKNLGKIPYCKHDFDEWQTVLEATCTSIGYSTHECDICGYVEYKFAEAKGHKWDDGEEFAGKILKTCTVCQATQIEEKPFQEGGDNKPDDNTPDDGTKYVLILPVENVEVIIGYKFAYDPTLDRYSLHQGIDFKCEEGTEVKAVLDGTVKEIVSNHILGENYIKIEHSDGLVTAYKYIVPVTELKIGDTVKQGDIIGTVAAKGGMEMNEGEHLHFEVIKNGKTVDPAEYFNEEDLKYADGIE